MRLLVATMLAFTLALTPTAASGDPSPSGGFAAETVATGLASPTGFTFAPDGRIFYGERFTGEIRIYDPDTGSDTLFATVPDVSSFGEQGLLGLALHPRYPTTAAVYAFATRIVSGQARNQIVMFRDRGGSGANMRVIFSSDTVSGSYHDGGRILFGPDRMLYTVVGEGHSPTNAQNLDNNAGKVLRMTANGRAPADNPFPDSLIWSYGLRNSYGFDFDPENGNLWESENGPGCNDEINLIVRGGNFAWGPAQTCSTPPTPPLNTNQDGPTPRILPEAWYTPTTAPTGAAFCDGCGLTGAEGALLMGEFNTGSIRLITLTANRDGIASQSVAYDQSSGIYSMETGPDGSIYFSWGSTISRLVNG
jgi:glucose/arabinose dehydrogenase